jgi:hypothetical protein
MRWNNKVEVSAGEIIDKITILDIKLIKIKDEEKLKNIRYELECLSESFVDMLNFLSIEKQGDLKRLKSNLFAVNLRLWNVEDAIREKGNSLFGDISYYEEFVFSLSPSQMVTANAFMLLARDVYLVNGERFSLKTKINKLLESPIVEEKSH